MWFSKKKKVKDLSIHLINKEDCGYIMTEEELLDHITDDDRLFGIFDPWEEEYVHDDYNPYEHDGLDCFGVEEEAKDHDDDDDYYDNDDDDDYYDDDDDDDDD